jgi:hypothetical protein
MEAEEEEVADLYMERIKQFGYVAMFSQLFPLAGPLAFLECALFMGQLVLKFGVQKRGEPSISMGAGVFLRILE